MKAYTAIDLESAQGYCIRICQFELVVLENAMITQEVHLLSPSGLARVAKERGVITLGIVLIPLFTEAKEIYLDIDKLLKEFDSLLVIDHKKSNTSKTILNVGPGLLLMNESVATVIKGISAIVLEPQFEIKEIRTVLCDNNSIFAGFSVASGKNRAKRAVVSALTSPQLRKNKMVNVKNVLLLLTSGTTALTIDEIGEINDYLQAAAGYNASITVAVFEDMKLGKSLSIAIIAS
jgi:cell division protein FtsZ